MASKEQLFFLSAKHCWHVFPGPTISSFGAHEMRVIFHSDGFGTANGFDAHYEIREAFEEEVPTRKDRRHCGELIEANDQQTTGHFGWSKCRNLFCIFIAESPGYPVKYGTNKQCDWEIRVRPQHQVLLKPNAFNVEGQMTAEKVDCMRLAIGNILTFPHTTQLFLFHAVPSSVSIWTCKIAVGICKCAGRICK